MAVYKQPYAGSYQSSRPAYEDRSEQIARSQARKEDSIKLAGSARDATLIVTTFYPEIANEKDVEKRKADIIHEWTYWKEYFYGQLNKPF